MQTNYSFSSTFVALPESIDSNPAVFESCAGLYIVTGSYAAAKLLATALANETISVTPEEKEWTLLLDELLDSKRGTAESAVPSLHFRFLFAFIRSNTDKRPKSSLQPLHG